MGGPPGMRGGMGMGRRPGQPDLTQGPITRTLLIFSLPLLGSNILQSLNATANQFWVSHMLGATDITAIGNANSVMFLMLGAIMGATMAANILIAQQVGAGDLKMVKRIMGTAVFFFVVISTVIATLGATLAPHILGMMRTPPDAKAQAIIYLRIVFFSMPFMYFFQFLQMAQRGAGDSKTPFYFMFLAVVLDMVLNPLLIGGVDGSIGGWGIFPKVAVPLHFHGFGIAGSAMSTLIGQGVALILLLIRLYRRHSVLMLKGRELKYLWPSLEILNPLVLRGIPMSLQMFIMSAAGITMIGFVNGYGSLTSAAYVGAVQVWNYIQMPGMAIGASVSSMAGQNVGAGRWDRVNRIALSGLISSTVVTGAIAVLIYALGPIPLFPFLPSNPPALIQTAEHIDHTVLWAFVIFNATFALSGVVRSTGAVWPPMAILVISMIVIRVPFAFFMRPYLGQEAIWWSFPLGTVTSSALTALYFRYGGWRKVRMLHHAPSGEAPDGAVGAPTLDPQEADEPLVGEFASG